ncbi:hypothetical protein DFR67_11159 [Williamsia limnetica]|uniref:Lipoprotein n=1 Tax=Williamsia limnetica TaxID=882452 RepID=A0A318RL72_WILLI|nr:hypothetical protein [Williamsia limnetica]PYE14984.1 hypothetical protein DFR67_11159 [Williamsia limnetica]
MVKSLQALTISALIALSTAACVSTTSGSEGSFVESIPSPNTQPEFSLLTDEGVQQIKDSGRARFDLRDRVLTNAEAGVAPESRQEIIIGNPGDPDIQLTLVGPEGEVTISTQTIWFTHLDEDSFTEIIFFRAFETIEIAKQELNESVTQWGILQENIEMWSSVSEKAQDDKVKRSLGTGVGATGLIVGMNASIKRGTQVFHYIVDLDPRNYNEENIANIRSTGIGRRVVN